MLCAGFYRVQVVHDIIDTSRFLCLSQSESWFYLDFHLEQQTRRAQSAQTCLEEIRVAGRGDGDDGSAGLRKGDDEGLHVFRKDGGSHSATM